jgi:hypothetical protein
MSPKPLLAILTVLGLSVGWLYRYELMLWIGKILLTQALTNQ